MSWDYNSLRHFADSWGLAFMALSWFGLSAWTFRRGARAHLDAAANSIFAEREDRREKAD